MEDLKNSVAKIGEKVDAIREDISDIKLVQVSQAADLKYHIMRTTLSEQRLQLMEDKLLPLVTTKNQFDGAFKFLGKCGSVAGFIFGALKAVEFLLKLI